MSDLAQSLDDYASILVLVVGVGPITKAKYSDYYHMLSKCKAFKVGETPLIQKPRMCGGSLMLMGGDCNLACCSMHNGPCSLESALFTALPEFESLRFRNACVYMRSL